MARSTTRGPQRNRRSRLCQTKSSTVNVGSAENALAEKWTHSSKADAPNGRERDYTWKELESVPVFPIEISRVSSGKDCPAKHLIRMAVFQVRL